jgi:hypothetical protein
MMPMVFMGLPRVSVTPQHRPVPSVPCRRATRSHVTSQHSKYAVDAARIIVEAMERDAYRVMIGGDAKLLDRLSRFIPERSAGFIYKQMKARLAD